MSEPTPAEIRVRLAELLGWSAAYDCWGIPPRLIMPIGTPGPESLPLAVLPDPASDLNAMAAVEAVLETSGRHAAYLNLLIGLRAAHPPGQVYPAALGLRSLWQAVTAPAAVRALAAYRVLEAKS
jgi:hypothetical protein